VCIGIAAVAIYMGKNSTSANNTIHTPATTTSTKKIQADFTFHLAKKPNLKEYAKYNLPTIIDYGADYCPPCKKFYPIMEQANKDYAGKAFLKYIDTEKNPAAVGKVPIKYIPTQLFWDAQGKPFAPSKGLGQKIRFAYVKDKNTNERVYTMHVGPLTKKELQEILQEMGVK